MNTKGKSVLIVEDDAKIRQLVKVYLEREGYEALEAEDGEDALEKFKQFDPCLVILDLMLPGRLLKTGFFGKEVFWPN
ncbi:hypothetical protein JCM15765_21200 [Paradesulfitobacterium aromaticivorans]